MQYANDNYITPRFDIIEHFRAELHAVSLK